MIRNEINKTILANINEPVNPILISSLKSLGKLVFPYKCFLQLRTSDSDKRK